MLSRVSRQWPLTWFQPLESSSSSSSFSSSIFLLHLHFFLSQFLWIFSKNLFKQPAFRLAGFSFSASFFALLPWLFLLLSMQFSLTCLKELHSHEVVWSVRHAARQDFILYAGIYSYKFHLKDYCGGLLQVWGRLGRSPGWAQGTHCALLLPGVPDPGLFRHCCDNGHCYTKVSREEWKSHYNRSTSPYNPR